MHERAHAGAFSESSRGSAAKRHVSSEGLYSKMSMLSLLSVLNVWHHAPRFSSSSNPLPTPGCPPQHCVANYCIHKNNEGEGTLVPLPPSLHRNFLPLISSFFNKQRVFWVLPAQSQLMCPSSHSNPPPAFFCVSCGSRLFLFTSLHSAL